MIKEYFIVEICSNELGNFKFVGEDAVHFISVTSDRAYHYPNLQLAEIAAIKYIEYKKIPSTTPIKIHRIGYIDTPKEFTAKEYNKIIKNKPQKLNFLGFFLY